MPWKATCMGRTETQYLLQIIRIPSWSQSQTGKVGMAEPFEQSCLQMQAIAVLQVCSRMPYVGGDIPGYTGPFHPPSKSLLPLYLTMTSVSKTCTSQSTALCSDMMVFSGASWKRNGVTAEGTGRKGQEAGIHLARLHSAAWLCSRAPTMRQGWPW